jgi:hypothetical protein
MSVTLPRTSTRAADWSGKDTSTLMVVARERALAGDRILTPTPSGARPLLIVSAVITAIAALWCVAALQAPLGTRIVAALILAMLAARAGLTRIGGMLRRW